MDKKSLGQIAYEAYCATTDWKSAVTGAPLPQYNEQREAVIAAWEAAGTAVAAHVLVSSEEAIDNVLKNAATNKPEGLYRGAFSNALVFESVPEDAVYDQQTGLTIMDSSTLVHFGAIIAYKTAHNLSNGFTMDEDNNPLQQ